MAAEIGNPGISPSMPLLNSTCSQKVTWRLSVHGSIPVRQDHGPEQRRRTHRERKIGHLKLASAVHTEVSKGERDFLGMHQTFDREFINVGVCLLLFPIIPIFHHSCSFLLSPVSCILLFPVIPFFHYSSFPSIITPVLQYSEFLSCPKTNFPRPGPFVF